MIVNILAAAEKTGMQQLEMDLLVKMDLNV